MYMYGCPDIYCAPPTTCHHTPPHHLPPPPPPTCHHSVTMKLQAILQETAIHTRYAYSMQCGLCIMVMMVMGVVMMGTAFDIIMCLPHTPIHVCNRLGYILLHMLYHFQYHLPNTRLHKCYQVREVSSCIHMPLPKHGPSPNMAPPQTWPLRKHGPFPNMALPKHGPSPNMAPPQTCPSPNMAPPKHGPSPDMPLPKHAPPQTWPLPRHAPAQTWPFSITLPQVLPGHICCAPSNSLCLSIHQGCLWTSWIVVVCGSAWWRGDEGS